MSESDQVAASPARKSKTPLMAGVSGVVLLAVIVGAWLLHQKSAAASLQEGMQARARATVHLESFIVNLSDRDEKSFLRIGIDLGLAKEPKKSEANSSVNVIPNVRDVIIGVLTSYKADDLLTPQGKQQLKNDLLKSLNERAPDLQVSEIYFTDFLVQR